MSSSAEGKHTGSDIARPSILEPSFAERARTWVHLGRVGTLSTHSRKQLGFPFGSVMPYALDEHADPIFLISTMAMHTQNLMADHRSSLLVTQPDAVGDPLGASRVTLLGGVLPVSEKKVSEARKLYLARHTDSKYWVDFKDFAFYRMNVADVYYVGGFGVMGWVSAAEYYGAQSDPLADCGPDIIQHMNADHAEALILLAKAFAEIEATEAVMTSVDRLGFHVRLKTQDGRSGSRIAFLREVHSPGEAREVFIDMTAQARRLASV